MALVSGVSLIGLWLGLLTAAVGAAVVAFRELFDTVERLLTGRAARFERRGPVGRLIDALGALAATAAVRPIEVLEGIDVGHRGDGPDWRDISHA